MIVNQMPELVVFSLRMLKVFFDWQDCHLSSLAEFMQVLAKIL